MTVGHAMNKGTKIQRHNVAQRKAPSSVVPVPTAPPVYRPQPLPKVLQRKLIPAAESASRPKFVKVRPSAGQPQASAHRSLTTQKFAGLNVPGPALPDRKDVGAATAPSSLRNPGNRHA